MNAAIAETQPVPESQATGWHSVHCDCCGARFAFRKADENPRMDQPYKGIQQGAHTAFVYCPACGGCQKETCKEASIIIANRTLMFALLVNTIFAVLLQLVFMYFFLDAEYNRTYSILGSLAFFIPVINVFVIFHFRQSFIPKDVNASSLKAQRLAKIQPDVRLCDTPVLPSADI